MKKNFFFLYSLVVVFSVTMNSNVMVFAENVGGGQVEVKGRITFQNEATQESAGSIDLSNKKNSGKFPNTGEKTLSYSLVGGGLVVAIFCLFRWIFSGSKEEKT